MAKLRLFLLSFAWIVLGSGFIHDEGQNKPPPSLKSSTPNSNSNPIRALAKHLQQLSPTSRKIVEDYLPKFTLEQIRRMNQRIDSNIKALSNIKESPTGNHPEAYLKSSEDLIEEITHKEVGKKIVESSVLAAAKETGQVIGYRGLNPDAYKHIAQGVVTKEMSLKAKTAPAGSIIGGLIPISANFSKSGKNASEAAASTELTKKLLNDSTNGYRITYYTRERKGRTEYAVYREGGTSNGQPVIENWKTEDEANAGGWKKYEIMGKEITQKDGKKDLVRITADVDLAFVGRKGSNEESVRNDPVLGRITAAEEKVLSIINKSSGRQYPLSNHGSQAFDPAEHQLEGKVKVVHPNGKILTLSGQEEVDLYANYGSGKEYDFQITNRRMGGMNRESVKTSQPTHLQIEAIKANKDNENNEASEERFRQPPPQSEQSLPLLKDQPR